MTIEFNTHEFEFSHGHRPRGRGGWAFQIRTGYEKGAEPPLFWSVGTYVEAKRAFVKALREWARGGKCDYVEDEVCS